MQRLAHFIILIPALFIVCCKNVGKPAERKETVERGWKKIPDEWIKKALQFNYKRPDTTLINQFAELIKPDTLYNSHITDIDPDYKFIFNPIRSDLDGDGKDEILCLLGWGAYDPYLCVFKQLNNSWYLIYKELIDTFYESPTLYITNNYSKNKTFYLRRVYDHGSGVYIDGYSFYKLVNNKVYECLNIVNDAHIDGWGLYVNQSVQSKFNFRGDSDDELSVTYSYYFFPGSIYDTDCSWCSHDEIPLIKGEDNVDYSYSVKEHKYKLNIANYKNDVGDLTADKIACFADFGNDSLFVKAFRRQIDTILKIGTPLQKKIFRKYLSIVAKNKNARTQEMEVKSKAGETIFYGPKK